MDFLPPDHPATTPVNSPAPVNPVNTVNPVIPPAPRPRPRTLTADQRADLTFWMKAHPDAAYNDTASELAALAADELDFDISPSSAALIRGAVYPELKPARRIPVTVATAADVRLGVLEDRLNNMADWQRNTGDRVANLSDALASVRAFSDMLNDALAAVRAQIVDVSTDLKHHLLGGKTKPSPGTLVVHSETHGPDSPLFDDSEDFRHGEQGCS